MKSLGIQNKQISQPGCGIPDRGTGLLTKQTLDKAGQSGLAADSANSVSMAMWAGQQSQAEGCLQTLITVSSHRMIHGATLEESNCLFEV